MNRNNFVNHAVQFLKVQSVKMFFICSMLLLASSCQQQVRGIEKPVPKTKEVKTQKVSEFVYEKNGIQVEIAQWKQIETFIQKQKGKVVVLDIWSSYCIPCIKEYPHLVELQKQYPGKVVCCSVNVNYDGSKKYPPESSLEEVMTFLVKKKSKLKNFISSTPDEDLYNKIDLASIPVVYVYSPDGKLVKRFDNESLKKGDKEFSYSRDVNPLVKTLAGQVKGKSSTKSP